MKLAKNLNRKKGQGMTEYIIIVVLVAIALIVAVAAFGGDIKSLFNKSEDQLENLGNTLP